MISQRFRSRLVWLAIGACAVAAIWIKVRLEAGASLERAIELEQVGDVALAITVYRHTLRWYSPASGPVEAAADRLVELGRSLEAEHPDLALSAWRALRSGLYGVRSLYQPYPEKIRQASDAIAALMARQEAPSGDAEALTAVESHHRVLLDRDHAPDPWWSLLAVVAFGLWAFALLVLAVRGFDDESGALVPAAAAPWGALWIMALALWMAGLARA